MTVNQSATKQDKITKKVGIIIAKLMDLQEMATTGTSQEIQHVIDKINEIEGNLLSQ